MAQLYTRVKDKATGHEYDILAHTFDPEAHTRVDKKQYPDTTRPRPAKPNVKGKRTASSSTQRGAATKPAGGDAASGSGDAA